MISEVFKPGNHKAVAAPSRPMTRENAARLRFDTVSEAHAPTRRASRWCSLATASYRALQPATVRATLNEIECSIAIKNEGFENLVRGSQVRLEEVLERAPSNWYVEAEEAKRLGLVEAVAQVVLRAVLARPNRKHAALSDDRDERGGHSEDWPWSRLCGGGACLVNRDNSQRRLEWTALVQCAKGSGRICTLKTFG
jgi:hypothetical protein